MLYKEMYMWLVNFSELKKTSLRWRPCGLYCTSYNAELNTCLIGHVFIGDVEDKELCKKIQDNLDIFKLAFSDAVDSLVPALLNAMAATGES